jgi:RNA polymerase sigma-70 factor (ECF subfamily)
MAYEEIADVLEVPVGTVKSRLHRARGELKIKLQGIV